MGDGKHEGPKAPLQPVRTPKPNPDLKDPPPGGGDHRKPDDKK